MPLDHGPAALLSELPTEHENNASIAFPLLERCSWLAVIAYCLDVLCPAPLFEPTRPVLDLNALGAVRLRTSRDRPRAK
jgi:hypothetical protein